MRYSKIYFEIDAMKKPVVGFGNPLIMALEAP
jgi:hypothetical protein